MALFSNVTPTRYIWVSPSGSNSNSGTQDSPLKTIQAAINKATPGTAVMVKSGTYVENVQFTKDGTITAPIQLISADGPQKATIKAATNNLSAVYAFGEDNIVIKNFQIQGGKNGIEFTQSGNNHSNYVKNLLISGNKIVDAVQDGIKVAQGDNVDIIDNVINRAGDQGIDFVAVNGSVIARNEVSHITGSSGGIFVKGSSTNVRIEDNWVHHTKVDGIVVGGWTEKIYMRPGYIYEAKNIIVTGNKVEDVGKRPINVLGALDSKIYDNYLEANASYPTAVNVGSGSPSISPRQHSSNVDIYDNVFNRSTKLITIESGSKNIKFHDNATNGKWSGATGPYSNGTKPDQSGTPPQPSDPDPIGDKPADAGAWKESASPTKTVSGSAGADTLYGTSGNDRIDGKAGLDTMVGGKGDDSYVVGSKLDKVVEKSGEGVDTIYLWDAAYTIPDHVENLTVSSSKPTNVTGNSLNNIIKGGSGNDLINGGKGGDLLYGGAGRDGFVIEKGNGSDTIADFVAGSGGDYLDLRGFAFSSFAHVKASTIQQGNNRPSISETVKP